MSNLGYFRTGIATLAMGVFVLPSSARAQKQPSKPGSQTAQQRAAQEEDIREAAFLFLFSVGTGPDPDYSHYCLSVDSKGFSDPSDSLMKRLSQARRTLCKFTECEIVSNHQEPGNDDDLFGRVKVKKSGERAWLISLGPIMWVNDHKVQLEAERYCGGSCAWGSTLQATLHNGKWKVTIAPGASVWVS